MKKVVSLISGCFVFFVLILPVLATDADTEKLIQDVTNVDVNCQVCYVNSKLLGLLKSSDCKQLIAPAKEIDSVITVDIASRKDAYSHATINCKSLGGEFKAVYEPKK